MLDTARRSYTGDDWKEGTRKATYFPWHRLTLWMQIRAGLYPRAQARLG